MNLETLVNIAKAFFYCRSVIQERDKTSTALDAMVSVLRVINFDFLEKDEILVYYGDRLYWFKKPEKIKLPNKITPVDIKSYDRECIEDILNMEKYIQDIILINPIFEAMGWVLTVLSGTVRMHFEGSATYEIWNEPLLRWDEDMDDDSCDWKSGTGWRDGLNLENIKYDWLENLDDFE